MSENASAAVTTDAAAEPNPWRALWALLIGFFMILVDSTIVSVAIPAIMTGLDAGISDVIWVTSAYLLAYAVPLLITGRMGDRFGPKRMYLAGLTVFTIASFACGLASSVEVLIAARAVQGLGASMLTPQTMAIITRTFPPNRRGAAMGLWGSVAGAAVLVGPIAGGLLVDSLGWEWIFFVNVPVGVIGFLLALRLVPRLPTSAHRFDLLGVLLSGVAMFCIVFGIEEGENYDWGTITVPISVWSLIIAGVVIMAIFIYWQKVNRNEPLLPLELFTDRNFSAAGLAITVMGFVVTALSFPIILYAQVARGLSPTESALLMLPMAILTMAAAPFIGRYVNNHSARPVAVFSFLLLAASLAGYAALMKPSIDIGWLLVPSGLMGIANAGIWGPLSVSATRNLPPQRAGAGSGVYNTIRQVGAVIGSAAIAAFMEARLSAEMPASASASAGQAQFGSGTLPAFLLDPYSTAMSQSTYLIAGITVVGALASLLLVWRPSTHPGAAGAVQPPAVQPASASTEPSSAGLPTGATTMSAEPTTSMPTNNSPTDSPPAGKPAGKDLNGTPPTGAPVAELNGAHGVPRQIGVYGRVSNGHAPLVSAWVTVADHQGHQVGRTTTDAEGRYSIHVPTAGSYLLIVSADKLAPNASLVSVLDQPVLRDISLIGTNRLTGRIMDRTLDASAPTPVAGAMVTVTDLEGRLVATVRSGSDGGYLIDHLSPGDYVLTGQSDTRRPVVRTVEVGADGATTADLTFDHGGRIEGQILAAVDRQPVAQATVTLVDEQGRLAGQVLTGPDGRYQFDDLDGGSYVLTASGFAPVAHDVEVASGRATDSTVLLGGPSQPVTAEQRS